MAMPCDGPQAPCRNHRPRPEEGGAFTVNSLIRKRFTVTT
jgi:hypothetical protein